MSNLEYYSDRFGADALGQDAFRKLLYGVFATFVNRFPAYEIAKKWNSGDPAEMFGAVVCFVNQMSGAESLEFETGDLVKVRPTHAKSGMLAVVKSTIFSDLNMVGIETENGKTLQIAGRHLEKTKLPKAIVDMAIAAVKAKMAGRCPVKGSAPCLS